MFTPEGINLTLGALAPLLAGGQLRVLDGDNEPGEAQSATAPVGEIDLRDGTLIMSATFGEQEANFDWRAREVLTADGTVLDRIVEDLGRKAPGSVWTLEAVVSLQEPE